MASDVPAEVYPIAHFVHEELEARGWSVNDFCVRALMSEGDADIVFRSTGPLSRRLANKIGYTFGTSPDMWLNLDRQFWGVLLHELNQGEARDGE